MGWHFIPCTLQYLVGGVISFLVTFIVFRRNPKSPSYRYFLLFGVCTAIWMFSVFAGRNAPSEDVSKLIHQIVMPCFALSQPLLLLTLLNVAGYKKIYVLTLLPAIVLGLSISAMLSYEVVWDAYGWAFSFWPIVTKAGYPVILGYFIAIIAVGFYLIRKTRHESIRRKYKIIVLGCIIYFIPINVTNILMWRYPAMPPFGGILLTLEFLIITRAILLPAETIEIFPKMEQPMGKFSESYLQFLTGLQARIPGKELGVNAFKFMEYVEAMGMGGIVHFDKSQELVFDLDKFNDQDMNEIPSGILKVLKEHQWATETMNDFAPVLVATYEALRLQSQGRSNAWFERILQKHGSFLAEQGVLAAMPKNVKIPEIFNALKPGSSYLFKEEKPTEAYQLLKKALNYGFVCLCISKLYPQRVKERYDVGKASMFWLTFEETEGTISPKDIAKLNKTVSEFVKGDDGNVVLLDCFDQIKFANGLHKSLTMLKDFRNLCNENNSIMLIPINPQMFEKQELAAIEKELREAR